MKDILMEIAQDTCGMTKGPRRHKVTWWWNEEVAEAVKEKKIKYGKWKKKTRRKQEEQTKCKECYLFSKGKDTEGMCK